MKDYITRDLFTAAQFRPFVRRTVRNRRVLFGVYQRNPNQYEVCAGLFPTMAEARQHALLIRKQ